MTVSPRGRTDEKGFQRLFRYTLPERFCFMVSGRSHSFGCPSFSGLAPFSAGVRDPVSSLPVPEFVSRLFCFFFSHVILSGNLMK
jgi:hypothetical protein